jgi:N-acetyl-alpha-D-muramate 1-phosphate uridylyltransferase
VVQKKIRQMKAMILAAGLGTRLKPFTDYHPKALVKVNGKSLLQRNVEYLKSFGVTDIIVNVHHFASQILETINKNNGWGTKITISDETDEVLETGGGLKKAAWFFQDSDEPFILLNVDILTDLDLKKLLEYHKLSKALATLAVSNRDTSRYFLFDENNLLSGWENIKTNQKIITRPSSNLTRKAFSGLHIISPEIFKHTTQTGKFSMVDVYLELSKTHIIKGFDQGNCKFLDVGKPESIVEAERMFL